MQVGIRMEEERTTNHNNKHTKQIKHLKTMSNLDELLEKLVLR